MISIQPILFIYFFGGGGTRYPTSIYIEGTIIFSNELFFEQRMAEERVSNRFRCQTPLTFFLSSFNAFLFTRHVVPTYPK